MDEKKLRDCLTTLLNRGLPYGFDYRFGMEDVLNKYDLSDEDVDVLYKHLESIDEYKLEKEVNGIITKHIDKVII